MKLCKGNPGHEMHFEKLEGDITRIRLVGRMDHAGATGIDAQFMETAGSESSCLVDCPR